MVDESRKRSGTYYTPPDVVASLVRWSAQTKDDRMLDPSCGDGRFLALHCNSAGVEQNAAAAQRATDCAPWAMIHEGDFFTWAEQTEEQFDCAAGNPPFIRYQQFAGSVRTTALQLCSRLGTNFSSLTSSWAPFLVATASLLRSGGRLAFVVPAEIGHAPYAIPLLRYLVGNFNLVQIVAVRNKIFRELSEDCWLLFAKGFGGSTNCIKFTTLDSFRFRATPPRVGESISTQDWESWNCRLRPFLTPGPVRSLYRQFAGSSDAVTLGDVAKVGIGYVTGANAFFHLRPSHAASLGIPDHLLHPTVRSGRSLTATAVTHATVKRWLHQDEPVLLLHLNKSRRPPKSVQHYLNSPDGEAASQSYKCRNREPWYVVPDVTVPSAFLSYMSGGDPSLVANHARCVCTNSVHAVHLNGRMTMSELKRRWSETFTSLSCEFEGHPLGGGLLKLEPREALRVVLVDRQPLLVDNATIQAGIDEMKRWRHYAETP